MNHLIEKTIAGKLLTKAECHRLLSTDNFDLLSLVNAAYQIRKKYFGNEVLVHILDNVQNGGCSEDCRYCAQSCSSTAKIPTYPQKSDHEIMAEASIAYETGAFRHCLVFSGERLSDDRITHLATLIREMRQKFPMEICVSAGFINETQARLLKNAGLNRINHNLNTSRRNYPNICSTHTYEDRLATIHAARSQGLDVCSGVIVGMGETAEDLIDVALELRNLGVASIPVNFLLPIPGIALSARAQNLSPEYCLRILCLFRFLNPKAEIRIAAGREYHLRSLQVLGLYPANSLFLEGYLNAKGASSAETLQMIRDAGFAIRSEHGKLDRTTSKALFLKNTEDLRHRKTVEQF